MKDYKNRVVWGRVILVVMILIVVAFGYRKYSSQTTSQTTTIPECVLGHCPKYLETPWYVSFGGEVKGMTVLVVYTTMNKGAGYVLVVSDGKIQYRSEEMAGIEAKIIDNDLYIDSTEYAKDGKTTQKTSKIVFENGEFKKS